MNDVDSSARGPREGAASAGASGTSAGVAVAEGGFVRGWLDVAVRRVRGGELGALPVLVGLLLMAAVFQSQAPTFLSARNLSNLTLQIVPTGLIALGIVLVLLLGEVDLSAGSVSGLCAAVMAVLSVKQGWPPVLAIAVAVLAGATIGAAQGFFFARLGVPSFVVTLAGLIGWQGALLYVLGATGTLNIPYDGAVAAFANTFLSRVALGYAVVLLPIGLYLVALLRGAARRARAGLPRPGAAEIGARAGGLLLLGLAAVYVLNLTRGVPLALVIFVGLVAAFDLVLRKTRAGRMVFAVGGNAEAARRAGINVAAVRITTFAVAAAMAAVGGVMQASRLFAVNQASGSGDVLLNAIAAAVIGGTSLFGGRGSAWSALLGMLVIGSIQSGILLLDLQSDAQYMITAAVLLVAVTVDALSRRGRKASGRA
ncbi:MAG TPA: sugar ABC transporter permease [Thermoanaerobaculia bacterium]|nr:sugar ABC transporter permease [Thermoanaerobaculia bacterium]